MAALQARGVACKPYLPAIHLQPFYRSLGHREGELPVAEAVARSTLALPFHTRLGADDQAYVAACARRRARVSDARRRLRQPAVLATSADSYLVAPARR